MMTPCRILYVDKHQDSRDLVSIMLQYSNLSYEIVSTDSSGNAVQLAENQKFDLYIFDHFLPEISGVDLCRAIRQKDQTTPVMFFTTQTQPERKSEALDAGAQEYLIKPDDLDVLTKTVEKLLKASSCN